MLKIQQVFIKRSSDNKTDNVFALLEDGSIWVFNQKEKIWNNTKWHESPFLTEKAQEQLKEIVEEAAAKESSNDKRIREWREKNNA